MVRLNRITMQGFKSFANKISIPFPTGFNIVCGPNGSGKSNIIDALMFVLGTSSARTIRAAKLQNLLFNGAKDKKPAQYCEVSIYLDNKDKKIPIDEEEIKISRRMNRNGVSVYKINGKTATRTKVVDMLSHANLSPEGYNIIMQGDVTNIIEKSPKERREIIDDIAGISEFDEKREKAQREFEIVDLRVRENMVIRAEKQQQYERIKKEKENAEKYQKLNSELRKARASLLNKRISDLEKKIEELENEIKKSESELVEFEKNFKMIEEKLEKEENEIKRKNEELIAKSQNYKTMKIADELKTEIIRKKDKISFNKDEIERLKKSISARSDAIKEISKKDGVYGCVEELIKIPSTYSIALEVALGNHKNDIIVSDENKAIECINYLKKERLGRLRFLPLDKIKGEIKKTDKFKHVLDVIKYDKKYENAIKYILGKTIIIDKLTDKADGFRAVTIEGDIKEMSGALVGGYYRMKSIKVKERISELEKENKKLMDEINKLEEELKKIEQESKAESEEAAKLMNEVRNGEKIIEELKNERKKYTEKRIVLQKRIGKLSVEKAKVEATLENFKIEMEEYEDVKELYDLEEEELLEKINFCSTEIRELGPINMKAIEDFKTLSVEYEELGKKLDKLIEEKKSVIKIIEEVEKKRHDKFMQTLNELNKNFKRIFKDLINGEGNLRLEEEGNIESGLIIEAELPGKGKLNLDSISGGEKTLTSLAFLFAIMEHYSSPFYVLDEVDAALDKANTKKITNVIKKYSKDRQFIVITHNDITIAEADKVFGVSMEDGVSKVFAIEMPKERG